MIDNPFLETERQIVGDIYTSAEIMENLLTLCDELGSRFAGSYMEQQAADFMKAKLVSYGLSKVELEAVHYSGWRRGEVTTLEITSPIIKRIPCITLPHSPAADLKGWIVDVDQGAPEDFSRKGADIAGKIVLTTSHTYPSGSKRWIHRNEKFGRSMLAGAIGFIFVNHYPGYGPATGGIGYDDPNSGAALIPGISISMEDGAFIKRLLRRHGQVEVQLCSTDVNEPVVSWNVIAELTGKQDPDSIVMLGCHYDGHDISQGAADPASGTVALLEAARVLAQYAPDLPATIRFALWSAEEIGLIGSTQYVQQHAAELDKIRFYLNMDMAGAIDPKDIVLNEWPALAPLFENWREEMALDFGVGQSLNAHSDHFPFMVAGVPTGGIGSLEPRTGGRGYGHTMFDTVEKVEMRGMREAAALAARLALRMASAKNWPVERRTEEQVKGILDSPDYREETELSERARSFYREHSS
jgi:aminopeptidase YwaD